MNDSSNEGLQPDQNQTDTQLEKAGEKLTPQEIGQQILDLPGIYNFERKAYAAEPDDIYKRKELIDRYIEEYLNVRETTTVIVGRSSGSIRSESFFTCSDCGNKVPGESIPIKQVRAGSATFSQDEYGLSIRESLEPPVGSSKAPRMDIERTAMHALIEHNSTKGKFFRFSSRSTDPVTPGSLLGLLAGDNLSAHAQIRDVNLDLQPIVEFLKGPSNQSSTESSEVNS